MFVEIKFKNTYTSVTRKLCEQFLEQVKKFLEKL